MGNGVSPAEFFRAVDDSDLDVYETRYLMRVWRRKVCWEKVDNIAPSIGMSRRQAYYARASLLEKGWLTEVIADGRVAHSVAIPDCCVSAYSAQDVQDVHEVVHEVHEPVHTVHEVVHEVHALPINRQNEDHTINHLYAPAPAAAPLPRDSQADPELIAAREATLGLVSFWEELTKRTRPDDDAQFREKWVKPFNAIWIACGRNLDTAKAKIQAVRNSILAGGGRIFDPSKLPAHVQALVDAELLPMTAALNGNGYRPNFRNDPEAREAHNRKVMAEVAADFATGGFTSWTPST